MYTKSFFAFLIFLVLSPPLFLSAQETGDEELKIYAVDQQGLITLDELVASVANTDVLFWGEQHDDRLGHQLQDSLYTLLLNQYGSVSLSLEMFETDCQQILDEYLLGFITQNQLIRDGRAWKNYEEAYHPIVETAKTRQQKVIAANTPQRYINLVSRQGPEQLFSLPKSSQEWLPPLPIYTADSGYYQRFQSIMGDVGHQMSDNVFYAQCTWDATMAYSIFRHWRKHKQEMVFHLNGSFHTDYQQGTFAQLRRLNKKIILKNISCFPAEDFDQPDWSKYSSRGDFIIITRG